jgi:Glycosyl transferase family 2
MRISRAQTTRPCPRRCCKGNQSPSSGSRSIVGTAATNDNTAIMTTVVTGMATTSTRNVAFLLWCFFLCVFIRFSGVWFLAMVDDGHQPPPTSEDGTLFSLKASILQGGGMIPRPQRNALYCPPPRRRRLVATKSSSTTSTTTITTPPTRTTTITPAAVLCAMAKDEEAYLDEWVNYHLAIGFETIYIYDNSDTNELRQWGKAKAAAVQKADSSASPVCRQSLSSSLGDHGHDDNEDTLSLPPSRVQVLPWPGEARQFDAYWDCGNRSVHGTMTDILQGGGHDHVKHEERGAAIRNNKTTTMLLEPATWAAFWDIDEFLILRQHDRVADFLQEYCTSGSLAISWIIMGGTTSVVADNGKTIFPSRQEQRLVYSPVPMTKRFLYRDVSVEGLTNSRHIKSIVKLSDLKLMEEDGSGRIAPFDHPHLVKLKKGVAQRDTNGRAFSGPRNRDDAPRNVAVLYHYNSKSRKEYIRKRLRGRAPLPRNHTSNNDLLQKAIGVTVQDDSNSISENTTLFDDTVWKAVKRYVPEYAIYDQLSIIPV